MSKELSPHAAEQVNKVLTIMGMTAIGFPLKRALKEVGMSHSTYYRWYATAAEAQRTLQEAKDAIELIQYADILNVKATLTRRLLSKANRPNISALELVAVLEYLDKTIDDLAGKHRPSGVAVDFLDGPTLTPGISTHRDVDIEVEGVKIKISNQQSEIIDVDPKTEYSLVPEQPSPPHPPRYLPEPDPSDPPED